jgi:hypothetical protein
MAGASFASVDGTDFDLWNPRLVTAASPKLLTAMLECLN